MSKKFSGKQQLFINAYLLLNNASKAALQAGYSPKTAFRAGQENMQKPAIKQAIDKHRAKVQADHDITMGEVTSNARQLVGRGLNPEPVLDSKGNKTGEFKYDSQAVAKGNSQLMQLGQFGMPDKGNGETNIQINIVNYGSE